jgi:serine/threonine protein kinase
MSSKSFSTEFLSTYQDFALPKSIAERFDVLECIGNTDLGETFLLSEKSTASKYVMKTNDEYTLLNGLSHEGIPEFENVGEGSDFSVRKWLDGMTLHEYLEESSEVDEDMAISIIAKLCDVLTYLHSQPVPIIHRDIKPSNIIINYEADTVTLIDFGIARKYSENSQNDTTYFGTESYSPPEQYGFAQTDSRTDIYSLGVVMRYWLTGTTDRNCKISDKRLERIASKCTELAPESRFQNAGALKKALNNYKHHSKRLKMKMAGLAATLLLCAGVTVAFMYYGGEGQLAVEPEVTTTLTVTSTNTEPPSLTQTVMTTTFSTSPTALTTKTTTINSTIAITADINNTQPQNMATTPSRTTSSKNTTTPKSTTTSKTTTTSKVITTKTTTTTKRPIVTPPTGTIVVSVCNRCGQFTNRCQC